MQPSTVHSLSFSWSHVRWREEDAIGGRHEASRYLIRRNDKPGRNTLDTRGRARTFAAISRHSLARLLLCVVSAGWRIGQIQGVSGVSDIKDALREHIIAEFMDGQGSLDDDTALIEQEIIDSLGIFILLGFITERFGVEIDPEDVTLDNFGSINAIAVLVDEGRRSAA